MKEDSLRQPLLGKWPSLSTSSYSSPWMAERGSLLPSIFPATCLTPCKSLCCFHCLVSAPNQKAFLPSCSSSLPKVCFSQNTQCSPCLPLHQAKALQDQEWLIPTPTQETPPCQMWHLGERARQTFYGFKASLLYIMSCSGQTRLHSLSADSLP